MCLWEYFRNVICYALFHIVTHDCCFETHFCTTKTYVAEMSCNQLLLIESAVYVYVQDQFVSYQRHTHTHTLQWGSTTLALLYSTLAAINCPPRLCNVGSRKGSVENKICVSLVTCQRLPFLVQQCVTSMYKHGPSMPDIGPLLGTCMT